MHPICTYSNHTSAPAIETGPLVLSGALTEHARAKEDIHPCLGHGLEPSVVAQCATEVPATVWAMTMPSRISTVRWARAATSASCVTMTIVIPWPLSRSSRSKNRTVDAESRLPVGSSARRMLRFVGQRPGDCHSLALTTRELRRETALDASEVHLDAAARVPRDLRWRADQAGPEHRELDVRRWRSAAVAGRGTGTPAPPSVDGNWPDCGSSPRHAQPTTTEPDVGESMAAKRWRSVDFPQPEGPVIATVSPARS